MHRDARGFPISAASAKAAAAFGHLVTGYLTFTQTCSSNFDAGSETSLPVSIVSASCKRP